MSRRVPLECFGLEMHSSSHLFIMYFLSIFLASKMCSTLHIMLGPRDTKINTVWFLTSKRLPGGGTEKSSQQAAPQPVLSPLLSCGLQWGDAALPTLGGAVKPVRSLAQPTLPTAQHSLFASFYHPPGQHSQPFSYSSNTPTYLLLCRQSTSPTAFPESSWEPASSSLSTFPFPVCI